MVAIISEARRALGRRAHFACGSAAHNLNSLILIVPEPKKPLANVIKSFVFTQPRNEIDPDVGIARVEANLALIRKHVDELPDPLATALAILGEVALGLAQEFDQTAGALCPHEHDPFAH